MSAVFAKLSAQEGVSKAASAAARYGQRIAHPTIAATTATNMSGGSARMMTTESAIKTTDATLQRELLLVLLVLRFYGIIARRKVGRQGVE